MKIWPPPFPEVFGVAIGIILALIHLIYTEFIVR